MEYWSSRLMFLLTLVLLLSQSLIDSSTPSPSNNFLCHPAESSALLQFINSFIINPSMFDRLGIFVMNPKTVSWKNGTDCCSWDGVLCDHISGHVIGLNLSSNYLQGPLHSNSTLFSLPHLQTLILDFNDFSCSPIPPEIGSFPNMKTLSLCYANFSGYVPEEISHLSKLSHLTIYGSFDDCHFLMGPFVLKKMLQNFTNLVELTMNNIDMSDVELVSSFMNVSSSLTNLDLYQCGLRGKFPENVFRLPNLQELNLGFNPYLPFSGNLTGSLPMFNWSSPLRYLDLSHTKISIDLPYMCSSAKSLQILQLSNCSFKGSSNSAMLTNLTQLVELSVLGIGSNNLGGQIPLFLLNLQQLIYLDLSGNNFVGKIPEFPEAYSSLQLNLEGLIISDNLLDESIPSWVYSLPYLKYLLLNNNKLIGPIKEFHSKSLEILALGSNKLHGQIPNSLFQQKNLQQLDLSHNNLDGVLELNKFSMLKNLQRLYLSFNNFTVSTNKYTNNDSFPQLSDLGLASCNIREFPYFLKNMKSLQTLQLSHNQIQGRIPEWLWNEGTSSLYELNISHNFLTSVQKIPCKSLDTVDLRSNMIQGPLPTVPPSVSVFFISNNALSGEIPSTYCNLSELEILDVSNNSIHGKIPSCLGNKFSLSVLDLHSNSLSGEIPRDMFEKLTNLRSLHLSNNHLYGSLPRSLRSCQSLEVLNVGNNKINDTFPHWLEDLPMLRVLVLKSNRFHGFIRPPKVEHPFQKLQIMDLSNNEFNGLLPTKHFESFTSMMDEHSTRNLTYIGDDSYYQDSIILVVKGNELVLEKVISIFVAIDFSRNNFEGEIPGSIGELKSLKGLNFSRNKLQGSIPVELIKLSNLEWLDLSSNGLVGVIPTKMAVLTQLSNLNLSHNKLVGEIPHGNQFDTFNKDSYSGNLELCGPPVSKSCTSGETQPDEDDDDDDEDDDGVFDWKIVMMGYGCGIILGISVGYMVLYSRRFDYWLNKKVRERRRRMS